MGGLLVVKNQKKNSVSTITAVFDQYVKDLFVNGETFFLDFPPILSIFAALPQGD